MREILGIAGLVVAAAVQTLFVLAYSIYGKWWRNFVGRALWTKSTVIMVALWVTLLNAFMVYPYQEDIAFLLMWAIAAAIIYQFAALIHQLRQDRANS